MTLVNTRAAFEKAVTDAVAAVDATVEMIYDNMIYKTPGKTKKYIIMSIDFAQATSQTPVSYTHLTLPTKRIV